MMTDINFEKVGNDWVASWISTGDAVMQLERKAATGIVAVMANMPNMEPVLVAQLSNGYGTGIIAALKVAAGLTVTVRSSTEIVAGRVMD